MIWQWSLCTGEYNPKMTKRVLYCLNFESFFAIFIIDEPIHYFESFFAIIDEPIHSQKQSLNE